MYWEDGKVHPVRFQTGSELDEGIWDYMYQSVIGFYAESKWNIYEIEEFAFDIQSVTMDRLDDTRERVTVDFDMKMSYRNPFRDPDEAGYIKQAKETGHPYYETFYNEYYQQQTMQNEMRFVMDIQPNAIRIYEDTVYEESIQLYTREPDHPLIEDDGKYLYSYEFDYDTRPIGAWYCSFQVNPSTQELTADRNVFVQDRSGRTNNGFFAFPLGFGTAVTISEDSTIFLSAPAEDQKKISEEEWKKLIEKDTCGNQRYYTAVFKENADGDFELVEAREGYWKLDLKL